MSGAVCLAGCVLCGAPGRGDGATAEEARDALRARGWVLERDDVCPRCALVAFPDPWGRYAVAEPAGPPAATSQPRPLSRAPRSGVARLSQVGGAAPSGAVVVVMDAGLPVASAGPAGDSEEASP